MLFTLWNGQFVELPLTVITNLTLYNVPELNEPIVPANVPGPVIV
jgi:hypothetical protein